mgnify:CR=1 FL=1
MENSYKPDKNAGKNKLVALYKKGEYRNFITKYEAFKKTEAYRNLTKKDKDELKRLYRLAKDELDRKKDLEQKVDKTNQELLSLDGETESKEDATQDVGGVKIKIDVSDLDNTQTYNLDR